MSDRTGCCDSSARIPYETDNGFERTALKFCIRAADGHDMHVWFEDPSVTMRTPITAFWYDGQHVAGTFGGERR